jgi:hypothetical protein
MCDLKAHLKVDASKLFALQRRRRFRPYWGCFHVSNEKSGKF